MRTGLFFLLLGLGAGSAIGYLLGVGTGPGSVRTERAAEVPAPPPAIRETTSPGLADALRSLPVPSVDRGAGSITGVARTDDGAPVAGVLIRAVPRAPERPEGAVPAHSAELEQEVLGFVDRFLRTRLSRSETTTGRSGAYLLAGLREVPHRLQAYLAGHIVEPVAGSATGVRPGAQIDFVARPAVAVPVEVLFADGSRPEWAMVRASGIERPWTPTAPEILLAPASYKFSAVVRDRDAYKSDEVERLIEPGAAAQPVVLRLENRPGIRGHVRLRPDERFGHLYVRALKQIGSEPPDPARLGGTETYAGAKADDGYAYVLRDLEPGAYLLGIDPGEQTIVATRTVVVHSTMVTCDFDVGPIDPRQYVVVRVFSPDGELLRDFELSAGVRHSHGGTSGGAEYMRRPDGSLLVLHDSNRRGEQGTIHFVTAVSERYGSKQAQYRIGERNEVEIRYGEPATLELSLAGYDHARHEDVLRIELVPDAARDAFLLSEIEATPGPDGRATLGPVEAGSTELLIRAKVGRWHNLIAVRKRIELAPGPNPVSIGMPKLYTLSVDADSLSPKAELTLYSLDKGRGYLASATADTEGRLRFPNLVPGHYELQHSDGASTMTVTLRGSAEVTWLPQAHNAFRATIWSDRCPLAKLGLEDNDLIVAIGGTRIEDVAQGEVLLGGAAAKAEVSLIVRRGSRTIELRLSGEALARARNGPGGQLEPATRP